MYACVYIFCIFTNQMYNFPFKTMDCNILLPLCSDFKGSCVINLLLEQVTLTGVCTAKDGNEIPS